MEHWAYYTDDDEYTKKEPERDASQTQYSVEMERKSADSRKPHIPEAAAVTNAPDDPSWANLEPHPENARPPPRMDPPAMHFTFAPEPPFDKLPGTHEQPDEDEDYQDPRLPPGVIDITEDLRRRHRERQKEADWAQQLLVRFGLASAGPQNRPTHRNEPLPRYNARGETTRNGERKAHGPPPSANSDVRRPSEPNGNMACSSLNRLVLA